MQLTRRSVLGNSLLLGAAASTRGGPPDWAAIRAEFPLRNDLIYMNAANIAPAPVTVWREY